MACKKGMPLSESFVLVGKSKCTGQVVDIDPASIPNVNDANVCEAIDDCQTIKNMKAKDVNLQHQIDQLIVEKNKLIEKDKDLQDQIDQNNERDDSQDSIITQINTEISSLKTDYITVINKLNSLGVNVILDEDYTSFEEWIENVYIPACGLAENEFSEGDRYINTNPSLDSEQGVYVNVREKDSTEPCSINDWYKLPYDIPELAIIGIDPIKVVHPYKGRFEVSIDQDKLADFISKLDHLDLSSVKLYLGDVYLDWVIKESLHIQEDLTVDNNTKTQNLEVTKNAKINNLNATTGHIETHDGDEKFLGDIDVTGDITAINAQFDANVNVDGGLNVEGHTETDTIHAKEGCIEKFTCDTDFSGHNIKIGDTTLNNTNLTSPTIITQNLHVTQDTHLDGNIVINSSSFNFQDPDTGQVTCLQNLVKNAFTPAYGFFTFSGGSSFSTSASDMPDVTTTCVPLCKDDTLQTYRNLKQGEGGQYVGYISSAKAQIDCKRDETNQTSGVGYESANSQLIVIHGEEEDYKGVYRLTFQLTMGFTGDPFSLYAHRAGIIVVNANDYQDYTIYDDKHASSNIQFDFNYTHTHGVSYYDSDYEGGSRTRTTTTDPSTLSFTVGAQQKGFPSQMSNIRLASDDHYTYNVSIELPIDKKMYVIPFFKASSGMQGNSTEGQFEITEGRWVNGGVSRLSIVKTCNLGIPADIHCEGS